MSICRFQTMSLEGREYLFFVPFISFPHLSASHGFTSALSACVPHPLSFFNLSFCLAFPRGSLSSHPIGGPSINQEGLRYAGSMKETLLGWGPWSCRDGAHLLLAVSLFLVLLPAQLPLGVSLPGPGLTYRDQSLRAAFLL